MLEDSRRIDGKQRKPHEQTVMTCEGHTEKCGSGSGAWGGGVVRAPKQSSFLKPNPKSPKP